MASQCVESERQPKAQDSTKEEEGKNHFLLKLNMHIRASKEPNSQTEERQAAYQVRPNIA
jgi:hypothetical protein